MTLDPPDGASRRFRLLFITGKLAARGVPDTKGGTSTHLIQLIENLDRKRYEASVCALGGVTEGPQVDRLRALGTELIFWSVDNIVTPASLPRLISLARFIRRRRFDLVQTLLFAPNVFGVVAAWLAGTPAIICSKRAMVDWQQWHHALASRFANSLCNRIVVPSSATGRSVQDVERSKENKIAVIHNGVDTARFDPSRWPTPAARAKLGLDDGVFVAGTIGHLTPIKDHETLLRAWALVAARHQSARLLHVGGGPLQEQMMQLATSLGIRETVVFCGRQIEVEPYLAAMDVYVSSSIAEGFSNAVLEAMAMGLPVVATNVGGNPEAVVEGESGFLVPARNADVMGARLIELTDSREQRLAFGAFGRQRVEARFTSQQMALRYQELYDSILTR